MVLRSTGYINHEQNLGNGLIILNIFEPSEGRRVMPPEEFYALLCKIIPGFEAVSCFSRKSSSSRVKALNKNAYRFYILTSTPSGISDFIITLSKKLWVVGPEEKELGYIDIAKDGTYLERSVIDSAMEIPYQFDFCGDPYVVGDIEVTKSGVIWYGRERALDCNELPKMTEKENLLYKNRKEACVNRIASESGRISDLFLIKKCEEFKFVELTKLVNSKPGFKITDEIVSELEEEFKMEDHYSWLSDDMTELHPAFVLHFNDGRSVTVADVVKNPEAFHGCTLADPIEGDSNSRGTECAIFHNGNEGLGIRSMRIGGYHYSLAMMKYVDVLKCDLEWEKQTPHKALET